MIDLTVKTLDSQNHTFSVNDDITVRQFKEHIAETVNIPDNLQRLIYCGRVLQDEKLLTEYDVNGKVIHLVQRAPPSLTQRSSNSNQNQTQNSSSNGDWTSMPRIHYRQTEFRGNPMYVGSVSFPADVLEGYELPIPQLNNSLTNGHVSVIRRMLDQANRIIDRLDNPGTTDSTSSESASSTSQTPTQTQSEPATETEASSSESAPASQSKPSTPTPSASTSTPASTDSNSAESSQSEALVPRELAELLDKLLTTQDRLRPYIRDRLLHTPEAGASPTPSTPEENQRILDSVTECFHFLSHAQHALSNLNVNMQQPSPRVLRCRPITIQPSAILQAGLPIQVEAHINLHGQDANSDSDTASTTSTTNVTATTNSSTNSGNRREPTATTETSTPPPSADRSTENNPAAAVAAAAADSLSSMFNFSNNVEVVMEMGPQAPRVWTFSTGDQNQNSSNNNNNNNNNNTNANNNNTNNNTNSTNNMTNGSNTTGGTPGNGTGPGAFPWGNTNPPLPDIIRNVMQAVAGYMTQTNVSPSSIPVTQSMGNQSTPTTTATPGTGTPGCTRHRSAAVTVGENAPTTGQSSQTRGSTETHPTTSTQTRTTPRTHVIHQHAQALGLGVGLASSIDFDPFLPCKSYHLRRAQASTTSTAASTQTGQGMTDSNQPSNQSPAGSSARSRLTTIAGVLNADNIFNNTPLSDSLNNAARVSCDSRPLSFNSVLLNRGINIMPENMSSTARRSQRIFYIIYSVLGKIPMHSWINIVNGDTSPLRSVMQELREKLRSRYQNLEESEIPEAVVDDVFAEISTILDDVFRQPRVNDHNNGRVIELRQTVDNLIRRHVKALIQTIFSDADDKVDQVLSQLNNFCSDLGSVLCYSLRNDIDLMRVKARFSSMITLSFPRLLREFVYQTIDNLFTKYSRQSALPSQSDIISMIVYKDTANLSAATSSTLNNEVQSSSEPMDIDVSSNDQSSDALLDNEEVPSTFPGHTNLLPDWVPIIARDGVRQRRQLALGLSDSNVTTLSDAYLATMPSKRRKIVEQQKPSLLVSPSANSNSVVAASMERLVRESIGRAGSEEVDGAITALVGEPTVRRAFGQAIRESLNPCRYETPDFPDPLRFPNATKFFTDPNIPPK
ncbi:large proline-rich protein BAG6 [Microplitis mediator]|uniref:large proline-rich protein BAG6 n=1 Tax=Microplitis mediator TaxID=375433 RepID=UPI0025545CC6|nr:large proline-rich protein BAG6 [Microplitis mediator]